MNELTAEFYVKDGVEFISLSGAFMGKDVVTRAATEEDKAQYAAEYHAFKNPPKVEEPAAPKATAVKPKAESA